MLSSPPNHAKRSIYTDPSEREKETVLHSAGNLCTTCLSTYTPAAVARVIRRLVRTQSYLSPAPPYSVSRQLTLLRSLARALSRTSPPHRRRRSARQLEAMCSVTRIATLAV